MTVCLLSLPAETIGVQKTHSWPLVLESICGVSEDMIVDKLYLLWSLLYNQHLHNKKKFELILSHPPSSPIIGKMYFHKTFAHEKQHTLWRV